MLRQCAIYPPALCQAIVQGLEQQLRVDARQAKVAQEVPALAMDDAEDPDDLDHTAFDDAKGGELKVPLVRAARAEEMEFVRSRDIYSYSTTEECHARTGRPPVGTKWVDTNKGDDLRPNYRSRLVATEVRKPWSEKWFAATPPIEALRLLLGIAARGDLKTKRPRRLLVLDVSRAHWYPEARRDVFLSACPRRTPRQTSRGCAAS